MEGIPCFPLPAPLFKHFLRWFFRDVKAGFQIDRFILAEVVKVDNVGFSHKRVYLLVACVVIIVSVLLLSGKQRMLLRTHIRRI